jgi:hypothetical protein
MKEMKQQTRASHQGTNFVCVHACMCVYVCGTDKNSKYALDHMSTICMRKCMCVYVHVCACVYLSCMLFSSLL